MKQISDEELAAYQLGELPCWKRAVMRLRLRNDAALAARSEEIAATLRLFADDSVPAPSAQITERSWQRVRGAMTVLDVPATPVRRTGFWVGAGAGALTTAVLASVFMLHAVHVSPDDSGNGGAGVAATKSWSRSLLAELHTHKPVVTPAQYNNRPGPLTVVPADAAAEDPALATHLDSAERVLTEVSHTEGPLPEETRTQVHRLLLQNALYHQSAEQHGDMSTAAVIDDLGRVLITLDAEPPHGAANADAFRLQMNLGGVLLDLRILRGNDTPQRGQ